MNVPMHRELAPGTRSAQPRDIPKVSSLMRTVSAPTLPACPDNGQVGRPVPLITLKAFLHPDALAQLGPSAACWPGDRRVTHHDPRS